MKLFRIVTTLAAITLFASSATAQRNLDEAIKVIEDAAAGTQAAGTPVSFVAPPRTIADITEILDRQKPDPTKRAQLIARADAEPPQRMSISERADFFLDRGLAAAELGRAQQRLDDIHRGYRIAQEAKFPPSRMMNILNLVALARQGVGNFQGYLGAQNERLALADRMDADSAANWIIGINFGKVSAAANLGRLDLGRSSLATAEKALANLPVRYGQNQRDNLNALVWRARAINHLVAGNYDDADKAARQSIALFSRLVGLEKEMSNTTPGTFANQRDSARTDLAKALMNQGRLVEAESEIRIALLSRLERHGRYASETAVTLNFLTRLLIEQRRHTEAAHLADAVIDIYENIGHKAGSFTLAQARSLRALAELGGENARAARATYRQIESDAAEAPRIKENFLDSNGIYGTVLYAAGEYPAAANVLTATVEKARKAVGDRGYELAKWRGWLAMALAKSGDAEKAEAEFNASIPILLTPSRAAEDRDDDGGSADQRDRRTQKVVEGYLSLLFDTKGPAAAEEAFRLADAVRGKSVQRALAASAARTALREPGLAKLARLEQDAQKQVAALQGALTNMLTRPTEEQDANEIRSLRERIDQLRNARALVRQEIEAKSPEYVGLIDPRPATIEQVQKTLRPGEAMIVTYTGDERLFVWAIPQQGQAAFASSKVANREIDAMVGELRKALDPAASSIEEVPAFDVALASKLYDMLLKPIQAGWSQAQSLFIVPHGSLGQLPMALLVTEPATLTTGALPFAEYKAVSFLARKAAVTQLPSVAALRSVPAPTGERQHLAAFGDPWFSDDQAKDGRAQRVAQAGGLQTRGIPLLRRNVPKTEGVNSAELALLPRLPDTADEVRSVALALKADVTKDVLLGDAANEKAVKAMDLSNRRVVMFATHGLVPGDLNGLTQPALALSAPSVANVDGDGLLTMEEMRSSRCSARHWSIPTMPGTPPWPRSPAANGCSASTPSSRGLPNRSRNGSGSTRAAR